MAGGDPAGHPFQIAYRGRSYHILGFGPGGLQEGSCESLEFDAHKCGLCHSAAVTMVSGKLTEVSLFMHIKVTGWACVKVPWMWRMVVQTSNPSTQEGEAGKS